MALSVRRFVRRRRLRAIFDHLYSDTVPSWDTGRPQPELVNLAAAGGITGNVLDIGCGSGENVLYLRQMGLAATGMDLSSEAIRSARVKAQARRLDTRFLVGDALNLASLGSRFDTIIACGLFHLFSEQEQRRLAASVSGALREGGTFVMLALSRENGPGPWPPGESVEEIKRAFTDSWRMDFIRPARFESRYEELQARGGAKAWLASFTNLQSQDR